MRIPGLRPRRLAPLAALGFLITAGCPLTPTFSTGYEVTGERVARQPVEATLAVRRFADQRPSRKYTTQGRMFLNYIPLVPYVSVPFERMDENARALAAEIEQAGATGFVAAPPPAPDFSEYAYPDSVARAIADDLRQQGLFREVKYVGDATETDARYVLDGTLHASPLRFTATSYCLGMPGVLLWLLPIPAGAAAAEISVSLKLTDTTSGEPVWQQTLDGEVSRILTLYNSQGVLYGTTWMSYQMVLPPSDARVDRRSLFAWHFEALRRAMEKARPDLVTALAQR